MRRRWYAATDSRPSTPENDKNGGAATLNNRSVSPAGSRLPVVRYDWLACGTRLRNAHTDMSVNYDWRSVFLLFGSGSFVEG